MRDDADRKPEELSLETSRASRMREEGRLPIDSREAAAEARRRLWSWLRRLFRGKS